MPPAVGRMHPSHMSNPFASLNPPPAAHQSSQHYSSQSGHVPAGFGSQQAAFPTHALNGGLSAFNPQSQYGASAFSGAASAFNAGGPAFSGPLGGQGQGLGSVAAQQGFARGAAMQEHTQQADAAGMGLKHGAASRIREVWRQNLEQEMEVLRELIRKYPFVSMDAEFPGIVARPIGNFAGSKAEYHYQTLRCNVDILKPIQIGITLWSADGELPPTHPDPSLLGPRVLKGTYGNQMAYIPSTWVFNLHFNLEEDMYSTASIDMLKNSGVDFARHERDGIPMQAFGSLLTTSGLAYDPQVNWLSFHSGYDFGYLTKVLSDDQLPKAPSEFFDKVATTFPKLWDIKFLLRHAQRLRTSGGGPSGRLSAEGARIMDNLGTKSGLQDLADELGCVRHGVAHTGGSDSWLTGSVFWAMRQKVFGGQLDAELADQIYGLHGVAAPASQAYRDEFFAATSTANGLGAGSTLQGGAQGYTPTNHPSTPTTQHAGLSTSQTPGAQQQGYGASGAYGSYAYGGGK
ncbi:Hypothetical protein R9X50_00009000 [Acrodontium crateriforme]|uniref:poly(A)-specific ribonuclease n=1 Tax=Acrodontium crateriforme TaxID=150365 RepID=A0AAQ3M2P2_9PEZI|nr:Hypothetical protein R9X50_00009000 [Acrodontium crateriforme]